MVKDHYIVLGIRSDASPEEIKSAYRQRALAVHPDHSGADCQDFIELQEAYQTLSNEVRRKSYDQARRRRQTTRAQGAEPLKAQGRAEPLTGSRPRADLGHVSLENDFFTYSPSVEDIFGRVWSNYFAHDRPKAEHVENLVVDLPLSAEQALSGGVVRLELPALVDCPTCGGFGHIDVFECLRCGGHGKLLTTHAVPVSFPPDLTGDHVVRLPLHQFGISNLFLTVRFRVSELLA